MTDSPTQQASPDTQVATTHLKTKDNLAFRGGARAGVSNTGGHAATDTRTSPSTMQQPSDALNDFDCVLLDDVGAGAAVPRSASAPATTGRDGVGGDSNEVEQVQEEATMAPERAPSGRAAAVERTKRRSIHRAAVRVSVCVCVRARACDDGGTLASLCCMSSSLLRRKCFLMHSSMFDPLHACLGTSIL
jgi:hypothetical protein